MHDEDAVLVLHARFATRQQAKAPRVTADRRNDIAPLRSQQVREVGSVRHATQIDAILIEVVLLGQMSQ